jgi:uncharacterized protein (TIGR03000 family)
MPPLPGTGAGPTLGPPRAPGLPPDSLLPPPPVLPGVPPVPLPDAKTGDPKKAEPKKDDPKKSRLEGPRRERATVVMSVPARATVTVEGRALGGTGGERSFRTPELAAGQEFAYTVRAVIDLGGPEEVETLEIKVTAGETSRASFEKLFAKVEAAAARSVADGKPGK